mgnify:CR=1 FL=1
MMFVNKAGIGYQVSGACPPTGGSGVGYQVSGKSCELCVSDEIIQTY